LPDFSSISAEQGGGPFNFYMNVLHKEYFLLLSQERNRGQDLATGYLKTCFAINFYFSFLQGRGVRVKNEPMVASSQPNDVGGMEADRGSSGVGGWEGV
jgi:hypothetical protein